MRVMLKTAHGALLVFGLHGWSSSADAGVVVVSRSTSLSIAITEATQPVLHLAKSDGTTTFADYANQIDVQGLATTAVAVQKSKLTIIGGQLTAFTAEGTADVAGIDGTAVGEFHLVFDVSGKAVEFIPSGGLEGGQFTLTNTNTHAILIDVNNRAGDDVVAVEQNRILAPGRYNASLVYGPGPTTGDVFLNAAFAAAPLPPAVWGGAFLLAACAGGMLWRRQTADVVPSVYTRNKRSIFRRISGSFPAPRRRTTPTPRGSSAKTTSARAISCRLRLMPTARRQSNPGAAL